MAHYAYISNAEFTTTERARLYEVENEVNIIRQDNIESEGYQLLYSSLESKETSETLQTLEAELAAIRPIGSEEYITKEEEVNAEKEKLAQDRAEIKDQLHELEYNNTEDLIAEKNTLETTIDNALCRVTKVIVGHDELETRRGDTSSIDEEIEALEESRAGKTQEEIVEIDQQIQTKLEEINNIPKVDYDNTIYWEGFYGAKRTSYNGNIRKNYAGKGHIYDPVRDAFYVEKPYPSWTLNEETCIWEPPTPKPEGIYYWNEATLEWVEHPYKRYKSWVWGNKLTSWNGYYEGDTSINDWFAPSECPDASELSYSNRLSSYIWNEDTLTWVQL